MKGAVDAFREHVQLLIETFGGKGYKLVSLSVNNVGALRSHPVMRIATMKTDASLGDAQASETEAEISQVAVDAGGAIEVQMP